MPGALPPATGTAPEAHRLSAWKSVVYALWRRPQAGTTQEDSGAAIHPGGRGHGCISGEKAADG